MFSALAELQDLTQAVHARRAPGAVMPEVCARAERLVVETEGKFTNPSAHCLTQGPKKIN